MVTKVVVYCKNAVKNFEFSQRISDISLNKLECELVVDGKYNWCDGTTTYRERQC